MVSCAVPGINLPFFEANQFNPGMVDSEAAQREAMEADDRVGLVEEYLDTPLPEKWPDMDLYDRRSWLADQSVPARQQGTVLGRRACWNARQSAMWRSGPGTSDGTRQI